MPFPSKSSVAPRVGAWIEIVILFATKLTKSFVAPRVGAWIEIGTKIITPIKTLLHPAWVHGLK